MQWVYQSKLSPSVQFENQICLFQLKHNHKILHNIWVTVVENSLLSSCSIPTIFEDMNGIPWVVSGIDETHILIRAPIENAMSISIESFPPLFGLKTKAVYFN